MWIDKHNEFAAAVAIGGSTGRRLLGDVVDITDQRDIGASDNIWLVVQVATTFTSGAAGTLQVEFVSDAQAAIATDGSATVHIASGVFALAGLTAGTTLLAVSIPRETGGEAYEQFIGIIGNVGSAAMTAGALNAFLTTTPPSHKKYPDGAR